MCVVVMKMFRWLVFALLLCASLGLEIGVKHNREKSESYAAYLAKVKGFLNQSVPLN